MTTGMIHTVYFWLTPGLSVEQRDNFVAATKGLIAAPTVQQCLVGSPAATPTREVTDNTFDYCLQLHFASVADHDAYQVSEVHVRYVEEQAVKFATVKVFDTELV